MSALYEQFLETTLGTSWYYGQTVAVTDPRAANVTGLLCPSDSGPATKPANHTSPTNYRMNGGDNPNGFTTPSDWRGKGHRGVFGNIIYYKLSAVTDGTSNTLAFSERAVVGINTSMRKVKTGGVNLTSGDFMEGFVNNTSPAVLKSRKVCMDTAVNGEYLSSFSVHEFKYEAGWNFAYGAVPDAGFITTLPPNAPSCKWDTGSYNVLRSATSYHSGGVNVSLLDGAVKFVSDTIDSGTGDRFPAATPVGAVSGQSPFGIWGAYGSRDGGEAASLP